MDVDLLRPGTVPISPDTVLWFEFLLDEKLLLKHLEKPSPDPSPTELISKFTSVVFESLNIDIKRYDLENGEAKEIVSEDQHKYSLKHLALKILSLKVLAHTKWNLDLLKVLPFSFQLSILQDLIFFTNNQTVMEIPNIPKYENVSALSPPYLFALVLYHRWVVKVAVGFTFNMQLKTFGKLYVEGHGNLIFYSLYNYDLKKSTLHNQLKIVIFLLGAMGAAQYRTIIVYTGSLKKKWIRN